MSLLPDDVIPIIQSFLNQKDYGKTITVSKAFTQPWEGIFELPFESNIVPKTVTKLKLQVLHGPPCLKNQEQLVYLDIFLSNVNDKSLKKLVNLRELKLGYTLEITDEGLEPLVRLKKLHLGANENITSKITSKIPFVERFNLKPERTENFHKTFALIPIMNSIYGITGNPMMILPKKQYRCREDMLKRVEKQQVNIEQKLVLRRIK